MIRVQVRYCAQARIAAGVAEEEIALTAACAPGELMMRLAKTHGDNLRRVLLDGNERPHPSVLLFIDGEQVSVNAPEVLKEGDVIEIVPPMSGG